MKMTAEKNLRSLSYLIDDTGSGKTAGEILKSLGLSKKLIIHLKHTNTRDIHGITVNGQHAFTNHVLNQGDTLCINVLETEESTGVPEEYIPVNIIYEDEDIQIVKKPAGLPVHPSKGHFRDSLGNALSYYTHHILNKDKFVYRPINRLDRDTSGILICAKNMLSGGILGAMLINRKIHREYLAICRGNPLDIAEIPGVFFDSFSDDGIFSKFSDSGSGDISISAPIVDESDIAMTRCVDFEKGAPALTHLKLINYNKEKDISLIRLRLGTGRTHQIRVHMLYIGHPLIGDFIYNPDFSLIGRHALHSHILSFMHPVSGEMMNFSSSLPDDMASLFPDEGL